MNWLESCKCELLKKVSAFMEKHKDTENPDILEALRLLEEGI